MQTQPYAFQSFKVIDSSLTEHPRGIAKEPGANVIATFPFPRDTVKGWIQERVWNLTNQLIDPDKVYLHQFSTTGSVKTGSAVTGWEHSGVPEKSMTLTEAVTSDFFRRNAMALQARPRRSRISSVRIPVRSRCLTGTAFLIISNALAFSCSTVPDRVTSIRKSMTTYPTPKRLGVTWTQFTGFTWMALRRVFITQRTNCA
jgi:hypothetical protein